MTRIVRLLTVLFVAVIALAAIPSMAFSATDPALFREDFDSGRLGAAWAPNLWGLHTNAPELQYYDSSALSFVNGGLRITSSRTPMGGMGYTSAVVTTRDSHSFSYGYFEMRAKLPKGQGIWPALWLTNDPSTHEIDAFELLGDDPRTIYMTYHLGHGEVYQARFTGPDFSAGYHTFGVDWQPTYIRWYVDGVLRGQYNGPVISDPLWICANTAVGGVWPGNPDATTVFPQYYDIDYIRVFKTMTAATTSKRVSRVAGSDRYRTAVRISAQAFAKADTVVIATGRDYADALAASPLAGALDAPVLLVPGTSVPTSVTAEIARLHAKKAVVVGGPATISEGVVRTLKAAGLKVERIAGANRYATAALLARRTLAATGKQTADTVFVARGDSYADALSVSSIADKMRFPVLLVKPGALPAETRDALASLDPERILVAGGPSAVSGGVVSALSRQGSVTRLAGTDRYGTSAQIAGYAIGRGWVSPAFVGLATGKGFPDALGGGAACGERGGVLLLTSPTQLSDQTRAFLQGNADHVGALGIYGGTAVVDTGVEVALRSMLP